MGPTVWICRCNFDRISLGQVYHERYTIKVGFLWNLEVLVVSLFLRPHGRTGSACQPLAICETIFTIFYLKKSSLLEQTFEQRKISQFFGAESKTSKHTWQSSLSFWGFCDWLMLGPIKTHPMNTYETCEEGINMTGIGNFKTWNRVTRGSQWNE